MLQVDRIVLLAPRLGIVGPLVVRERDTLPSERGHPASSQDSEDPTPIHS